MPLRQIHSVPFQKMSLRPTMRPRVYVLTLSLNWQVSIGPCQGAPGERAHDRDHRWCCRRDRFHADAHARLASHSSRARRKGQRQISYRAYHALRLWLGRAVGAPLRRRKSASGRWARPPGLTRTPKSSSERPHPCWRIHGHRRGNDELPLDSSRADFSTALS